MRTGAALAEWLADEGRQARGLGGSRRFANEVVARSPLAAFAGTLDALAPNRPGVSLDVLAALHVLLGDTQWVGSLVSDMAAAALADPFFEPPFASLGTGRVQGLVLLDHPLALVSVCVLSARDAAFPQDKDGPRSIGFPGLASVARVLAGGGAELAMWEADEPGADFSASRAGPCRSAGMRRIADGDLLAIDGRTQTFAVARFAGDLVLLRGEVRAGAATLAREFDSKTLELVAVSSTDEAASRTGLLLSLLRVSGRVDAGPLFEDVIRSGPFYLRWSAMREYLALDPLSALPLLGELARHDSHPEVRHAASATEARLAERYPILFDPVRKAA